jgi:hypothetical protein
MEIGQGLIVKYLQDLMRARNIDPAPMIFAWDQDKTQYHWVLTVHHGRSKRKLRVMESDILGWPWSRAVLGGRYDRAFRGLIQQILAA